MLPSHLFIVLILFQLLIPNNKLHLPVNTNGRTEVSNIELTPIGKFGLLRKARPHIPAHLHTGIDIKRPGKNYSSEAVFPISEGVVISKRTDGPYANLIIEHDYNGSKFWTCYEHIAGIFVNPGDRVDPQKPIARFMNKEELNTHGWQFDHVHFEILKVKPVPLRHNPSQPGRLFNSYTLSCYTDAELEKFYYDPLNFFKEE